MLFNGGKVNLSPLFLGGRADNQGKNYGRTQTLKEYYYDKNGNQTAVNVSTLQDSGTGEETLSLGKTAAEVSLFDYNGFNQLTKVSRDSNVSEYTYLPTGHVIPKQSME